MPSELDIALENIIGELIKEGQPFETVPFERNGVTMPAFKNAPPSLAYYFAHFLIILPIVSKIERPLPLPNSITEAVLGTDNTSLGGATASVGSLAGNAA